MIIEYDIPCFERTLTIKFPDGYKELEGEILELVDEYYNDWHENERDDIGDKCLEEYIMERLSEIYNMWEEWDSLYYGDDEKESCDNGWIKHDTL